MELSHLVIFSTSCKFITKFNVLRCISLSETLFWTGGWGFRAFLHVNFCSRGRGFAAFFARGMGISPPQKKIPGGRSGGC